MKVFHSSKRFLAYLKKAKSGEVIELHEGNKLGCLECYKRRVKIENAMTTGEKLFCDLLRIPYHEYTVKVVKR